MGTSPTAFINSPSAGTIYFGKVWAGCIAASGDGVTATAQAWTGANGGGSLTTVTGFEIWMVDWQTSGNVGHFGPGGPFNTVQCNHTATAPENNHYFYVAVRYTGGGSPASIGLHVDFSSSGFFWPATPGFSPAQGGPGTAVTITGSRFTDATSVDFNGTNDGTFVINSDIQIAAHVPSGATIGPIHVVNPVGSVASSSNFQPGQIFFGPTSTNSPVAVWYSSGGAPVKVQGVWVKDGAGVKRIW